MSFRARILADSVSPKGVRLTTMEWTFPRCILAEVNTHRMLSRNAASSRAIPIGKMIERVRENPFIPEFRKNQKGMQAAEPLAGDELIAARQAWTRAMNDCISAAEFLSATKPQTTALRIGSHAQPGEKFSTGSALGDFALDIHKQYVNRLLEPWMWCTIIVSATDWDNVWHLRTSPDAEPSFQKVARLAWDAMQASTPRDIFAGEWHLPLVDQEDLKDLRTMGGLPAAVEWERLCKISVGRCARVSYLTHDGVRDPQADMDLHDRLSTNGHWSPFEHVAAPMTGNDDEFHEGGYSGNFRGWMQYRKGFANENITEFDPSKLEGAA